MEKNSIKARISYLCYRVIRRLVKLCYPKITLEGIQHLPQEPCLIVGNHCQMNGPIIAELYIPGNRAIWCAGEMMHWKEVPAYAYQDFWSGKPKAVRWFYKLLSYLITPLSVCIFNNAHTIGVYRDSRILSTFRNSTLALCEGANVVVFPECPEAYNQIVNQFREGFVDIAKLYYKRTGKELQFVPMYNAPNLKKVYFGAPICFRADAPKEEERQRICEYLMGAITDIAVKLPKHTVVPYLNIPKKNYPSNIPTEEGSRHEKASG